MITESPQFLLPLQAIYFWVEMSSLFISTFTVFGKNELLIIYLEIDWDEITEFVSL